MYNEVSICVNDALNHPQALLAAINFSVRSNAILNGYFLKLDVAEILRWQSGNPMEVANQFLTDAQALEEKITAEFNSLTTQHNCQARWHTVNQSNDSLREMICSDIIFANQPQPLEAGFVGSLPYMNRLILELHRPVLMVPHQWNKPDFGAQVLLGWNSSPEAMRATSDAMPILQSADKVWVLELVKDHLFHVDPDQSPAIERYLESKKVDFDISIKHADSGRRGEFTSLDDYASEVHADLIVVGGYGHSRFREFVLGGMTKSLIDGATIPVLFSR